MLVVFALAACISGFVLYPHMLRGANPANLGGLTPGLLPEPRPLQPFALHTAAGRPFGLDDLHGRMTLLVPGYTSCPDICPMALAVVREVVAKGSVEWRDRSAHDADQGIQVAFLSVDPARDSPHRLSKYLDFFDERFIGLTGNDEEIDSLGRQIGLRYVRKTAGTDGEYAVDHTTSIAVIDEHAQLVALLPMPHDADRISSILARYMHDAP